MRPIYLPTDAGVWENLGDAQLKAGQFEEAVPSYRKSLNLDNNQERVRMKGLQTLCTRWEILKAVKRERQQQ